MLRSCLFLAVATACAPAPPKGPPAKPLVRVGGSDTMAETLLPALIEAHQASRGDLRFELTGGGTGAGLRQLLDGRLDIAGASRAHHPSDEEQAKANGFSLAARGARHVIGLDVVAVVAHRDAPYQSLTYDQVIGIFCTGSVDNLKFIDPTWGDVPIRPIARDLGSGTRELFEDFFCGPTGIHPSIEVMNNTALRSALETDVHVITFASMTENTAKAIDLQADSTAPVITPSQKNIANGSYPLYRDLYLYTAGPASGEPSQFIDWVLSPAGQEVVDENFFVPIYYRTAVFDGPRPLRETVHFEPESSIPNQRSLARIQLLVAELRQRAGKGQHIVLEGFTDNAEPDALELSARRAEAVKSILGQQLADTYFEIIPRGAIRPLAPNNTPFGRTRNRRVQIYLADEEATPNGAVVTPE